MKKAKKIKINLPDIFMCGERYNLEKIQDYINSRYRANIKSINFEKQTVTIYAFEEFI